MKASGDDIEPTDADLREAYRHLLETYRALAGSVRMIREAVEATFGASAGLKASDQYETLPEECEAIAIAIARVAQIH